MPGKNLIEQFLDNKKPSYQDTAKIQEPKTLMQSFSEKKEDPALTTMKTYLESTNRDIDKALYVMDVIGGHESHNNPGAIQDDDIEKPGRGLYQYERGTVMVEEDNKKSPNYGKMVEKSRGAMTAINRSYNFITEKLGIKEGTPEAEPYQNIIDAYHGRLPGQDSSKTIDMNRFHPDLQKFIFIADKIYGGKEQRDAFDNVLNNPTSDNIFDFWLNHHKRTPELKEEEYEIWQESGRGDDYSKNIKIKKEPSYSPFIQKNN